MKDLNEIENKSNEVVIAHIEKIKAVLEGEISWHSKLQAISDLSRTGIYRSNQVINKGVTLRDLQ